MRLGEFNDLTILRFTAPGAYLGDEEENDVLLPGKYIDDAWQVGDEINVFLYKDSEDRIVATTETPFITLKQFAYLTVKETNAFGAFLDWGLEKDLMVPFKEQNQLMEKGKRYLVTLQIDHATDRLFASSKINKYLSECHDTSLLHQAVDLLICEASDLGFKVIVNNLYKGLVFRNDVSKPIRTADKCLGYVNNIRSDGKIDIRLDPIGFQKYDDACEQIISLLNSNQILYLSDKSDADEIREKLGMSKKTFKQSIGKLYKNKKIKLFEDRIELV